MRPLLTLAFLATAGLATADDKPKPFQLTETVLEKPTSGSAQDRWHKQLVKDVQGKPVTVTGTMMQYYLDGKQWGIVVGGFHDADGQATKQQRFIRVFVKGDRSALGGKICTATGTGRVESFPTEVWIDDAVIPVDKPEKRKR
jgi:hypothetical protein